MKKWKKVETQEIQRYGKYYRVETDEVLTPAEKHTTYSVIRLHPHSVIIPLDPDGKIYLVKQHRYTTDQITLELPMGNTDGENPLEAAQRELEEETGLTSDRWEQIGRFQEANGIAEIYGHVFIARDVHPLENARTDELDQDLFEIVTHTFAEIQDMIAAGTIEDASTICAIAQATFTKKLK
jgi:8-oxo-dGTP pyrophosphatase MutT (NUDIX family)